MLHRPFHSGVWGFPQQAKRTRPGRDGAGRFSGSGYTPYACYVTVSPLTRRFQSPKLPAK
ncbi:TPA: hypothetical protein NOC31_003100 [Enterococcus faecium]|nr:hypothetical protein [Enterococcus faecium]HAX1303614.1 hypothetical protein [Enterococcus faecium]HAX1306037.1 hypothetical protein [Enterococcus faecium]HAX1306071.1 hypothetical protein [Enterococcus faecium]HCI1289334.1 hypothetical protein [Enterococcus faecium]